MASTGRLMKRCGCRNPATGRVFNGNCPKLRRKDGNWSSDHGNWWYQLELPATTDGARRQLRRGNKTSTEAKTELELAGKLLDLAGRDQDLAREIAGILQQAVRAGKALPEEPELRRRLRPGTTIASEIPTVGDYLTEWITELEKLGNHAGSTITSYESHIRVHLIPHLGHIRLDQLRARHVKAMIVAINARNNEIAAAHTSTNPEIRASVVGVKPTGPATLQRIRATLRNALNDAIPDELVTMNAAAFVKTPEKHALPMVWTHERVNRWRETGEIPGPVMVWTAEQTIEFLTYATVHAPDLHPLFHFVAYRGPRLGEACGLKDSEVRLDNRSVRVTNQITMGRDSLVQKPPKSTAGNRDLFYDDDTTTVLTAYKKARAAWKLATGPTWPNTGLFFVRPDGTSWRPAGVSQRFRRLIARCDMPPIRFHDLRHVAATVGLTAGVDIKVMQEQLGHTTPNLTRAYTSVVEELHRDAADAVAKAMKRKSA
jgi:integrase